MRLCSIVQCFVLLSAAAVCYSSAVADEVKQYKSVPPDSGEKCIVCGGELTEEGLALIVKGHRVPLDSMDLDVFLNNQEKYLASFQPRGALFAEATEAQKGTALGGVTTGWFIAGLYILAGLVFGGMSGYRAVSKGLPPILHFMIGFVFILPGYLYVLSRASRVQEGDIPEGLVKVPLTSAPLACEKCGYSNHPTARICKGCGKQLSPVHESEASRAT